MAGAPGTAPEGGGGPPAAADPNISEAAGGETPVAAVDGISAALGGETPAVAGGVTGQGADEGPIFKILIDLCGKILDRDRASRSSNWKQGSRPKKKFARRSPEECCLYCREPNHEFHECWDLWYLWFKHYTLKVPSWKKYLHSPELWKDPRIRGQVPPTWALPFSKSAAAKAKASAVAARRRPVVDKRGPQRAAEEELPSPTGKYTRSETTVTDGQASSAVAGGQASSAVACGGYIGGFFAPDGRWIAFGWASGVHPTKGSGETQYKRLPPRPALKSEAADESAEPPTHNPFTFNIRVNEEECPDDSGDVTVKEEEHSADESGQTPAKVAAAVADGGQAADNALYSHWTEKEDTVCYSSSIGTPTSDIGSSSTDCLLYTSPSPRD